MLPSGQLPTGAGHGKSSHLPQLQSMHTLRRRRSMSVWQPAAPGALEGEPKSLELRPLSCPAASTCHNVSLSPHPSPVSRAVVLSLQCVGSVSGIHKPLCVLRTLGRTLLTNTGSGQRRSFCSAAPCGSPHCPATEFLDVRSHSASSLRPGFPALQLINESKGHERPASPNTLDSRTLHRLRC